MKADIHPEYRYVVFRDVNNGFEFLSRSCAVARDTTEFEGQEYPLIVLDISSESHPFYTGTQRIMDSEGRVERFMRKYGFGGGASQEAAAEEATPPEAVSEAAAEAPAETETETETAAEETPADPTETAPTEG